MPTLVESQVAPTVLGQKLLTTSPQAVYVAPLGVKGNVRQITAANWSSFTRKVSMWLVPPGDTPGNANVKTPREPVPAGGEWWNHGVGTVPSEWAIWAKGDDLGLTMTIEGAEIEEVTP